MATLLRRWGSLSILWGLGATLVAALIAWIFSTTLENKITFAPVVSAIEKLNSNLEKQEVRNSREHEMIVNKLQKINGRININETKLFRVVEDCKENDTHIRDCQRHFKD